MRTHPGLRSEPGGLVVFGSRVPRLLPQWWGAGLGEDDSIAIQAAIDAGIHNRANIWEEAVPPELPGATYSINVPSLPCIPIELRGEYRLRTPVEIRGTATQNRLLEILGSRTVQRLPASSTARDIIFVGPGTSVTIPADFADPLAVATAVDLPAFARAVLKNDGRSIEITGVSIGTAILTLTRAGGTESVRVKVENPLRARREIAPVTTNTVIAGAWAGRTAHGARLVADPGFAADQRGSTLMRLLGTFGITLRNVAFEVGDASGPTCLDITPSVPPVPFQGVAVRGCSFAGGDATLVLLGPPPAIIPSRRTPDGDPIAEPSNYGSDISCIAFDECEFRPRSGGIGLLVRTSQSVPFRLRDCDFVGVARAMISAWEGRFLLDRCAFENTPPALPPSGAPGFEDPDGADIYLHFEPPLLETFANGVGPRYLSDTLAAFAATGCVSRSPRFLSTAHPFARVAQRQEWPVLLLNVRHVPSQGSEDGAAVLWGMVNRTSSVSSVGARDRARLGRGSPLVIVGGQFGGSLMIFPGAVQSVLLGARGPGSHLMHLGLAAPSGAGITWPTDVFGLAYDRRSSP